MNTKLNGIICFLLALCLKDLRISVPEAVLMGNAATMSCQYELEKVLFLLNNLGAQSTCIRTQQISFI